MTEQQTYESLDDAIQSVVNLKEAGNASYWSMGDAVNAIHAAFGYGATKMMASATGYTGRWLGILAHVSSIWKEGERRLDINWDCYHVASDTDTPHEWLNTVLANSWSASDLRRAIVKERGGTSLNSKQHAVRFCKNMERIWPHLRKDIVSRIMKPWQAEWYKYGQDDLLNVLLNVLLLAKAFEAAEK